MQLFLYFFLSFLFFLFCFTGLPFLFFIIHGEEGQLPNPLWIRQCRVYLHALLSYSLYLKKTIRIRRLLPVMGYQKTFNDRAFYHSSMQIFICSFIISMSANFEYIFQKITINLKKDLSTRNRVLTNQPKYSFEQKKNAKQYVKD